MRYIMAFGLGFLAVGTFCCSSGDSGSASNSGASSYGAISDSISHPTGQLDKTNTANVAAEFEKIASSSAAGRRIQGSSSANQEVSCPSGGKYTVNVSGTQTAAQANVTYDDCCYEASCCLNGGGVWYFSSDASTSYSYCGTYDISVSCGSDSGAVKYEGCYGSDGIWTYVVHVSNKTYAVSGTYSNGTGTLKITAANGSWTCTYTNNSGTCTGASGDFSF
jgi:hypothetical protein